MTCFCRQPNCYYDTCKPFSFLFPFFFINQVNRIHQSQIHNATPVLHWCRGGEKERKERRQGRRVEKMEELSHFSFGIVKMGSPKKFSEIG